MRCAACGGEVRIPATAPGIFFRIGLVAVLVAGAAAGWAWWAPPPQLLAWGLVIVGAGTAVYSAAATWAARIDASSMSLHGGAEPGRRCDACGHVTPVRPWSR